MSPSKSFLFSLSIAALISADNAAAAVRTVSSPEPRPAEPLTVSPGTGGGEWEGASIVPVDPTGTPHTITPGSYNSDGSGSGTAKKGEVGDEGKVAKVDPFTGPAPSPGNGNGYPNYGPNPLDPSSGAGGPTTQSNPNLSTQERLLQERSGRLSQQALDDMAQARKLMDLKKEEQAYGMTKDLAQNYPDSPSVLRAHAITANAAGHSEEAFEAILRAREIVPEHPGLRDLEKLLSRKVVPPGQLEQSKTAEQTAQSSYNESQSQTLSYQEEERFASMGPTMGATAGKPQITQDAAKLGLNSLKVGDPEAAEIQFTRKIEEEPNNDAAYRLRALARRRLHKLEGAHADAEQAVRLNPKDGWNYKTRALTHGDFNRFADAHEDIFRALRLNAKDADAFFTRAQLWQRQGKIDQRLADLAKAAELDAAFAAAYREAVVETQGRHAPAKRGNLGFYAVVSLLGLGLISYAFLRKRGQTGIVQNPAGAENVVGYEVLRKLGQGGMGEVWEAVDKALDRRVAIKRMREEISGDPRERQRFLKEARTVAALKHPNIVEIHSVLEEAGGLYLVFEHVDGRSLAEAIAQKGRLSLREARPFFEQIASALDYAHGKGVIHQDLKPANVMVAGPTAKVMDFGIARRVQETLSTLSRSEIAGTPDYMAPEQEQGLHSPQGDLFALGVCLYEALAGHRPFSGPSSLHLKLAKTYIPLSRVAPDLPASVDAVIEKALDPDPARRFKTAAELAASLRSLS